MRQFKPNTLSIFFSIFIIAVSIIYMGCNEPPYARINAPTHATIDTDVTLDGSGSSDPDGDYLHYQWLVTAQPDPIPPNDPVFSSTSEIARLHPTKVGNYTISLRVEDNDAAQDVTSATIIIVAGETTVAIAEASPEIANIPSLVSLNGEGSYDTENRELSYEWRFLYKPSLSNAEIAHPTNAKAFYDMDEPGSYITELRVSAGDDYGLDTISTSVYPPKLNFLEPISGNIGDTVRVNFDNMSYNITGNIVRFNTILATIHRVDSIGRDIVVTVPSGATTGFVTVEIAETAEVATSPYDFEVTQNNGDFSLSIDNTIGVFEGKVATYKYIGVNRSGNHNENISLSIKNKPDSVSFTFNPNPVPYDVDAVEMIMDVEYDAVPGVHQTTLVANDISTEKEVDFDLEILNQYSISTNPENITIAQDTSATLEVDIDWGYSEVYTEMVFTIEGSIIGVGDNAVEATFDPNPLPWGTFSNELILEVGTSVPPGTYPLTIKGATTNLEKSTILELTVESR